MFFILFLFNIDGKQKLNTMKFKPANNIQDLQYFGEFGGVNPSISDSATYTFLTANKMLDAFEGKAEGCHLYSRHTSPSNQYLGEALAAMENTQTANVAGSGMGAITTTLLHFCGAGDHIVSSRTVYGGTYAFLKNFAPRFNVSTSFVNITKLNDVEAAITKDTKVIYCEAVSNPGDSNMHGINTNTNSSGHWFVYEVNFFPINSFCTFFNGTHFYGGNTTWNTYNHSKGWSDPFLF